LLYGLQLASMNTARLQLKPYAPDVVRTLESTPDGLDLAEPGATLTFLPDEDEDEEENEEEE
jgi:hypothetical protein